LRRVSLYATRTSVADPTRLLTLNHPQIIAIVESVAPPARTVKFLEGNLSLPWYDFDDCGAKILAPAPCRRGVEIRAQMSRG
jgi:hypothetical protein